MTKNNASSAAKRKRNKGKRPNAKTLTKINSVKKNEKDEKDTTHANSSSSNATTSINTTANLTNPTETKSTKNPEQQKPTKNPPQPDRVSSLADDTVVKSQVGKSKTDNKASVSPPSPHTSTTQLSNQDKPQHSLRDDSADRYSEDSSSKEILGSDDDEQEDPNDYRKGGYHPVKIGDLYNHRYHVVRKLGWGHFSTVWLCWDMKEKRFVAAKMVKSAAHYTETAIDEIALLKSVRNSDPNDVGRQCCVQLLDEFRVHGVNGTHVCMIFEVLGYHLYKWILKSDYSGLPIPVVKAMSKQILDGLAYLHSKCKIIHTDLKPENILVCVNEAYVKKLAVDAQNWQKQGGGKLPSGSFAGTNIVTERSTKQKASEPMTKNRKKKLRKKENKKKKLLEQQIEQIEETERTGHSTMIVDESGDGNKENISEEEKHEIVEERMTSEDKDSRGEQNKSAEEKLGHSGGESTGNKENDWKDKSAKELLVNLLDPDNADKIKIKIADLGNACWTYKHFTNDIQTRQYRSIEVLLGAGYSTPADMWSTACMLFELATGDYLFEPHSGENWSRDEDHIALVMELLGYIPSSLRKAGEMTNEFFLPSGVLKNISRLKFWPLISVLTEKYDWDFQDAAPFADLLGKMLSLHPGSRYTAEQCLQHPWINKENTFDYVSFKKYLDYDRFARKWHWNNPVNASDYNQLDQQLLSEMESDDSETDIRSESDSENSYLDAEASISRSIPIYADSDNSPTPETSFCDADEDVEPGEISVSVVNNDLIERLRHMPSVDGEYSHVIDANLGEHCVIDPESGDILEVGELTSDYPTGRAHIHVITDENMQAQEIVSEVDQVRVERRSQSSEM